MKNSSERTPALDPSQVKDLVQHTGMLLDHGVSVARDLGIEIIGQTPYQNGLLEFGLERINNYLTPRRLSLFTSVGNAATRLAGNSPLQDTYYSISRTDGSNGVQDSMMLSHEPSIRRRFTGTQFRADYFGTYTAAKPLPPIVDDPPAARSLAEGVLALCPADLNINVSEEQTRQEMNRIAERDASSVQKLREYTVPETLGGMAGCTFKIDDSSTISVRHGLTDTYDTRTGESIKQSLIIVQYAETDAAGVMTGIMYSSAADATNVRSPAPFIQAFVQRSGGLANPYSNMKLQVYGIENLRYLGNMLAVLADKGEFSMRYSPPFSSMSSARVEQALQPPVPLPDTINPRLFAQQILQGEI